MLYPLRDGVRSVFFRGIGLGFLGGFVLVVLFFVTGGKHAQLTWARPSGLLYFLAGLEIGIALAVGLVFLVFHNLQARWAAHASLGTAYARPIEARHVIALIRTYPVSSLLRHFGVRRLPVGRFA